MARTIVVGYDGSEQARQALSRARELVEPGGRVTVVFATPGVPIELVPSTGDPIDPSPVDWEYALEGEAEEREQVLAEARSQLEGRGVDVETVGAVGDAADAIVAQARETEADLVIVGLYGLNPLERLLLGSVSEAVLHHAPCDVLIVRQPAQR